ncbi:choice-of-anchor J domain-containing protein [Marivirga sp. S37H4]|uniref:Choice-of-anchor J domain-containing protein n=1 Tax=Marivirga aurantiaca TaxID=2802615 RepID=A0A935C615_9BACT|nr:choice-of-anchor J domain-containing protein [Marivirga aurantiaca]MBK6264115.1 choice-of-anchor J domain-containing protein [Marivirga aurantiaca]
MKNIYFIIIGLLIIGTSCEEQPDYVINEGPFASYYPVTTAVFSEKEEESMTVFIESTGSLKSNSTVYVKVPNDPSIYTEPAYDPFTKEIPVVISAETRIGSFILSYRNNATTQKQEIFDFEIVRTTGEINDVATKLFQLKVIDDEFRIAVDTTVVLAAPSLEDFNSEEDGFCDADITAPAGWTPYSLGSINSWMCSFDGRGASGEDGDIAMEMNNFNSPDGEAADDWLITPKLNLAGSEKVFSFSSVLRYEGTEMTIKYSTTYVPGSVPTEFEWIDLPEATAAFDSDTQSFDFVESGDIDLSDLPDEIYIAFHYTSVGAGSGESSVARIDNFQIK